jgi:endonuclease YncB( thermonuclease family)
MRLHLLILLFIIGFNPNVSNAGTLVGEWYLEDTKEASNDERLAFSQPVSQSTDKTQVTLGLKSPGLSDLADFYLIAFNKVKNSNCQYTVSEVIIDAKSFAVKSANHSLEKSVIETRTKKDKTQLWRAFRKGNKMSLKIRQACSGRNVAGNEVNTFDFSLKGSSAAYEHVVGQKASVSLNQEKQKINKQVPSTKPEAVEATVKDAKTTVEEVKATVEDIETTEKNVDTTVENESSYTIYILLFVGLLAAVLVTGFLKLRARPKPLDSSFVPDSEKPGPELGDSLQTPRSTDSAENEPLVKPETYAATTPDMKQYIANIPRYKVEQVIDGDTITVSTLEDEKKIRLDSIDSPEDGQDWGGIAKDSLINLIGDKHVHGEEHETDRLGRTIATLYVEDGDTSNWINVNEKMVELGHAWVMRQYYDHLPKDRRAELDKLETSAKLNKLGLWESLNPIPPWDWRKEN